MISEECIDTARHALESSSGTRGHGIGGSVGDGLFACALHRVDRTIDDASALSRAVGEFNVGRAPRSLHQGLAGLGFVLAAYHDAPGHLAQINRALLAQVPRLPPASLQRGLAGIALYASLRTDAASGKELQRAVIDALAGAATPCDEGLLWHTPASYARARGIEAPGDEILTEFGVVHGISGTLIALAALARRGHRDAGDLAAAGLRAAWGWGRPGPNRFGRVEFGWRGAAGSREFDDRRWCVGDHGVLRAFWVTATTIGDSASAERALVLLRENAARDAAGPPPGAEGRIDLCCGAAAIAQVYFRMHLETGEEVFRVPYERLLAACAAQLEALGNPGFAYGRAGVILTLLSSNAVEEPIWDSILGMSLPRHVGELA